MLVSTVIRQAAVPVSTVIGQAGNTVPATVRQLRTRSNELACLRDTIASEVPTVDKSQAVGVSSRRFPTLIPEKSRIFRTLTRP